MESAAAQHPPLLPVAGASRSSRFNTVATAISLGCVVVASTVLLMQGTTGVLSSGLARTTAPRFAPQMFGRVAPQHQRGCTQMRAEQGFNSASSAEDLFAESKADDDSLFAILREPLRPPSEWVPVDVSGSDWLGAPSDDDLLNETPTESQEELLREYMRHENDKGSPEYQIAMITQRVYHLTKHLATNRKDYSTRRGLVMAIQKRRRQLVDLYGRDPTKFRDVVLRLGIRARLPPKPTLIAMDKKAPRRIKTKTNRPMGQAF